MERAKSLLWDPQVEGNPTRFLFGCIPHREPTCRVHPLVGDLRVMPVDDILQALCFVDPFKPLLCVSLLVEVACKKPISLQPPKIP